MASVHELALLLRRVFGRRRLEREMHEEMKQHLDRSTERLMHRGLSRSAAHFAARREFGNLGLHQENARDAWGTRWLDSLVADVRFGLRAHARKPVSTVMIVSILALGIGANSAIY